MNQQQNESNRQLVKRKSFLKNKSTASSIFHNIRSRRAFTIKQFKTGRYALLDRDCTTQVTGTALDGPIQRVVIEKNNFIEQQNKSIYDCSIAKFSRPKRRREAPNNFADILEQSVDSTLDGANRTNNPWE